VARTPLALPDFPWDALVPFRERAAAHPGGLIDLSVGSPVDETPAVVRDALSAATDAHAYPQTAGTPQLREAIVAWYARRRGVPGLDTSEVLPTIGSKELIALLPMFLGLGAGDVVVQPRVAYPTYAIGAALAGASVVSSNDPAEWPAATRLIWLNSPGNPDGRVLWVEQLQAALSRARELGAILVSDECYAEFSWTTDAPTPSILDPRVTGGDHSTVLSVYSLSKQSNLAGYRAGFIAGDRALISELLSVRKHVGLIPPAPVQAAMIAALGDDAHVVAQRELYRQRRARLAPALEAAGFTIEHSEAGLYLWVSCGRDAWDTVSDLAESGILVVPGPFYGDHAQQHIRVALTAPDADIDRAVARLTRN
jgi:succinyldiaminopimelate transaminase